MTHRLIAGLLAVIASVATQAGAQRAVAVRDLGPVLARSQEPLGWFYGLRAFPDGRVLVDDGLKRRLLLLDSTLAHFTLVADTTGGAPFNYGRALLPLIPFTADSVLFIDFASQSLLVIGPGGTMVRAMAPPKVSDLMYLRASAAGTDARGRIVYRGYRAQRRVPGVPPAPVDSAPVIRGDLDARTIDTLAMLKMPANPPYQPVRGADGKVSFKEVFTPITVVDEWAVSADGAIAIVRGHDYHIDWINPDGTRRASAKLPFDWRRLTDGDKQKLVDSMRTELAKLDLGGRGGMTLQEAGASGLTADALHIVTNPDGSKAVPIAIEFVPLAEIPDYYPPIRPGAVKADLDGNLWILPTTSAQSRKGGLVYDVVNRDGQLSERIELPPGRSIAGFGRGGTVYLVSGDRTQGFFIERAKLR